MTSGWTAEVNSEIVKGLIQARTRFYLASSPGATTFYDFAEQRITTFFIEWMQAIQAGYTQVGDELIPPGL